MLIWAKPLLGSPQANPHLPVLYNGSVRGRCPHLPVLLYLIPILWCLNFSPANSSESVALKLSNEPFTSKIHGRSLIAQIGDSASKIFAPQFKIIAWGGEALFQLQLLSSPASQFDKPAYILVNGRTGISVRQDDIISYQMYQKPDSGLEWEIILDTLPKSNELSFHFEQRNLLFLYQDTLSLEEIESGADRPDSVIGSYAVYHALHSDNKIVASQADTVTICYETGKAFHIYRPKVHDSRGWTVWCDMIIDSLFNIIIPQSFLDKADYPITIDPTFGNANIGASTAYLSSIACHALCGTSSYRHTASAGETINSFSLYCLTYSSPSYVSFAAYTYSGGYPENRLAAGVPITITNGAMQWNTTATLSQYMTDGITYAMAYGDVTPSSAVRARYDSEANSLSVHGGAGLPSTWVQSSVGGNRWSMYATYTANASTLSFRRKKIINLNSGL
jgi:hypothetical protein